MQRPPVLAFSVAVLIAGGAVLTACTLPPASSAVDATPVDEPAAGEATAVGDAWVVVMFENRDDAFDLDLMDALLETEMAADSALAEADAGWIDGNDVGDHGYELYFVGDDPQVMWTALEPVFAAAPVPWTRVELRQGLEDEAPEVLERE